MALLFVALVTAVLAGGVARARGRSAALWAFIGFMLGPIGVILAVLNSGKTKLAEDLSILVIGVALALEGCCFYLFPDQAVNFVAFFAPLGSPILNPDSQSGISDLFATFGSMLMVFGGLVMLPGLWARAMKSQQPS